MIPLMIKHKKSILIITLLFFLGSIAYLGLGAYSRTSNTLVAAMVGSEPITYRMLNRVTDDRITALRNQGMDIDDDMTKLMRQQFLYALISQEILNQAAANAGISVSDYEIAYSIKTSAAFAPEGKFDKATYENAVKYNFGMTPSEYEDQLRRDRKARQFSFVLTSLYKLTPQEIKDSYQLQHGNLKDFEENKADFAAQLIDTKMSTAQLAFMDAFNQKVKIQNFLKD